MVQLELPRFIPTTKNWLDRDVSTSELNHGTALERVRAGQGPVPLAAAGSLDEFGNHTLEFPSSDFPISPQALRLGEAPAG